MRVGRKRTEEDTLNVLQKRYHAAWKAFMNHNYRFRRNDGQRVHQSGNTSQDITYKTRLQNKTAAPVPRKIKLLLNEIKN